MKIKDQILCFSLLLLLGILLYLALSYFEKDVKLSEADFNELKISESKVKKHQDKYDSLFIIHKELQKQKQEKQYIYLKGKETVKYITTEKIERYTDTICKEDVLLLKQQIENSDSLIYIQEFQIENFAEQLYTSQQIIQEKDLQLSIFKNAKPKRWGLGPITGFGVHYNKKPSSFIGIGISYSLIRL